MGCVYPSIRWGGCGWPMANGGGGGYVLIAKRGGDIALSSHEKVQPNPSMKLFVICNFRRQCNPMPAPPFSWLFFSLVLD